MGGLESATGRPHRQITDRNLPILIFFPRVSRSPPRDLPDSILALDIQHVSKITISNL
ncbi:hypothetical protein TGAMA5MH_02612 [Trichoderma gamsii]|uniref:Uncharacterized protein n=1 Tax=Trichoderma gamsii TaxID=398673 RepID=A0A2K0TK32_9HYPO|nr:hypothetical protein TGAMA5MH_02612 [Trichoderma gamsii]